MHEVGLENSLKLSKFIYLFVFFVTLEIGFKVLLIVMVGFMSTYHKLRHQRGRSLDWENAFTFFISDHLGRAQFVMGGAISAEVVLGSIRKQANSCLWPLWIKKLLWTLLNKHPCDRMEHPLLLQEWYNYQRMDNEDVVHLHSGLILSS